MVLLVDNYDSFSYNLYQYIGAVDPDIEVFRNDKISLEEVDRLAPSHIVISPGPGRPADSGMCFEIIREFHKKIPILGICLGHQAIFEVFGGTVSYAAELMHGKFSMIDVDNNDALFHKMPNKIKAARYHSLAGLKDTLPAELRVIGNTEDGEIMAIAHKEHPTWGVQFHPESILTQNGDVIIQNFLSVAAN